MKHLLWVYFLISLVLFAALVLLSYGYGMICLYLLAAIAIANKCMGISLYVCCDELYCSGDMALD